MIQVDQAVSIIEKNSCKMPVRKIKVRKKKENSRKKYFLEMKAMAVSILCSGKKIREQSEKGLVLFALMPFCLATEIQLINEKFK